jgi:hypothetical protein
MVAQRAIQMISHVQWLQIDTVDHIIDRQAWSLGINLSSSVEVASTDAEDKV